MNRKSPDAITGPVIPLPTPFNSKYEVDYDSLGSYVKFLADAGIRNVMTTVGTSRFSLLTDEEVKKVNETVVRAAEGRMVTIVANPQVGGTARAIDFAKHAEQIGADYFLAYFPERHYGADNTYAFFKAIAEQLTSTGILIHEMPMRNGYGAGSVQYSLDLLDRLLDLPLVSGVKEEALDAEYSNAIVERISGKAIVIGAGGGMSRYFLRDFDRGSKAFLGGIGNFQPELELEFYALMAGGQREKAGRIVNEIELPYFAKTVPMGWHPSLKCALALKGLLPEFERPPMKQIEGEEKLQLKAVLQSNGWIS